MKGTLLLPHVSCKTPGNCIHVSYTNTHKWDSLFQGKDTQKDILKNCYPHPLWDFTVLSLVWNSETKNIGKTPGRRRRREGNLSAEGERNRRRARQQVSPCRQAQEKSPGVAPCQRRTGPLQEKEGRRSTACAPVLRVEAGGWENIRVVNAPEKASQFPSIVGGLKCAAGFALFGFFFFFTTSYIYL